MTHFEPEIQLPTPLPQDALRSSEAFSGLHIWPPNGFLLESIRRLNKGGSKMRIPEILNDVCFKVGHGALQAEVGMIRGRTRERAKDAGKNWRQKGES